MGDTEIKGETEDGTYFKVVEDEKTGIYYTEDITESEWCKEEVE